MKDILTVTMNPALDVSASTERIRHTSKLRCENVARHPGGGGVNVARVLHRLGADCSALYPVGGPTGHMLEALLDEEGVNSVKIPVEGHTRESFTVLDTTNSEEFRFVLPGPPFIEKDWRTCLDQIAKQDPPPRFIVGSGSLPPGVPNDFYSRVGKVAAGYGAKLIIDTSGAALVEVLKTGVYMIKPSLREVRELTHQPLPTLAAVRQAVRHWIDEGRAEIIAVSLGEQGALLVTANEALFAPPLPITVMSAVGAGDCFVAGMTHALAQGDDVVKAFRLGVACGSAALISTGTGLCVPEDVERLVKEVTCLEEFPTYEI